MAGRLTDLSEWIPAQPVLIEGSVIQVIGPVMHRCRHSKGDLRRLEVRGAILKLEKEDPSIYIIGSPLNALFTHPVQDYH